MSTITVDRVYANLLTHLQHPRPSISVETVIDALPHYLAHLPLPTPTQLTAFVVSSPLWRPTSVSNLRSLMVSYRTAVHFKKDILWKDARGWLGRSPQALHADWASALMKGVSRGDPQLRVAILGGILHGLNDARKEDVKDWIRVRLERQVVIACAEVMEGLSAEADGWENEFRSKTSPDSTDSKETLFVWSAYTILPLVEDSKFSALDLAALAQLSQRSVENAFFSGKFLSGLSQSSKRNPDGPLTIPRESPVFNSLQLLSTNILYQHAGSLAKLLARCLSVLPDRSPAVVRSTFQDVARRMESITSSVEKDWNTSLLSTITSENEIEIESRLIATDIWKVLKTLLFSHLLISLSILSSLIYLRPLKAGSKEPSPSSIARTILRSLYNQSFVLSQFGGIISSGDTFKELKRVFYTTIDVISSEYDSQTCESLVNELVSDIQNSPLALSHPSRQAKSAFVLAVMEQFMALLDDRVIEDVVVPFCSTYLGDPSHRETYESAHSVMLSIFAAHSSRKDASTTGTGRPTLAEKLVPFYVGCLIENSNEGRLDVSQLRLAYSSLVRSAATSPGDALAWLCVDALLAHIRTSSSSNRMPLYLTLVSMISIVPRTLLMQVLDEVQNIYNKVEDNQKTELKAAALEEIMYKVGDLEKQTVLQWWNGIGAEYTADKA